MKWEVMGRIILNERKKGEGIVLYFTLLYCIVLYFTVLYSIVLYCTLLYSTVLCCTAGLQLLIELTNVYLLGGEGVLGKFIAY